MPSSSPSPRTYQAASPRSYAALGIVSAFLSLFIVPEIFGPVAVILGAMIWKREEGNKGLYIIIAGLVCLVIGIEITAPIYLGGLLQ